MVNRTTMPDEKPSYFMELLSAAWVRYGAIVLGIIAVTAWAVRVDNKIGGLQAMAGESEEYRPRIESLEKADAVRSQQYSEIINRLIRIETKLDQ